MKTVEAGERIERPIEIRNAHERLIQQPNVAGNPGDVERHEDQGIPPAVRDAVTNYNGQIGTLEHVEGERNVPGEEITPDELGHDGTSIHTTSVQEWMSEPRKSWRQSVPRMQAIVSKIRPVKPEIRQLRQKLPPANRPQITQAGTGAQSNLSPVPKHAKIEPPGNPPISPHSSPPPTAKTREFFYPRAIAVKRDAWRYSVDAAAACDRERTRNRYSVHGQGFVDLQPMKRFTDPEILEKAAKLRRDGNLGKGAPVDSRRRFVPKQFRSSADHHTSRDVDGFPQGNGYLQRRQISFDKPNHGGNTSIPVVNRESPSAAVAPSSSANHPNSLANKSVSIMEISTPPLPNPPRTLRNQPSSISSNIRTPKSFYPPDYEPVDRVQVRVHPIETKAEMSKRGRGEVLERWTTERLQERRKEGRGVEAIGKDGRIWRSADVIFGKLKLSDGPPIIREIPPKTVRPLHPPPIPTQTNAIEELPPTPVLAPGKAPVRQNSPVHSSFSDLLSTSDYPQRIPEEAQHIPPPPSRAIVPYQKDHSAPKYSSWGTEREEHGEFCQETTWTMGYSRFNLPTKTSPPIRRRRKGIIVQVHWSITSSCPRRATRIPSRTVRNVLLPGTTRERTIPFRNGYVGLYH